MRWSWLRSDGCSKMCVVECFEKEYENFAPLHSGHVRISTFYSVILVSSKLRAFSGGYHRTHLSIPHHV